MFKAHGYKSSEQVITYVGKISCNILRTEINLKQNICYVCFWVFEKSFNQASEALIPLQPEDKNSFQLTARTIKDHAHTYAHTHTHTVYAIFVTQILNHHTQVYIASQFIQMVPINSS